MKQLGKNVEQRLGALAAYLDGELGEQIGQSSENVFDREKNSQRDKK